jgi:hypothetical protein
MTVTRKKNAERGGELTTQPLTVPAANNMAQNRIPTAAQICALNETIALLAYLMNVGDRSQLLLVLTALVLIRRRDYG